MDFDTFDLFSAMLTYNGKNISFYYNHLNLPEEVKKIGEQSWIEYIYTASGTKIGKRVIENNSLTAHRDYLNGAEYNKDGLDFIHFSEGRIVSENNQLNYYYQLKDHLGNIRVEFCDKNDNWGIDVGGGNNELTQETSYYPFGLSIAEGNINKDNKYLYNGKELQDELGLNMYDYGARLYDPTLGKWFGIDPMVEKYYSWTPYHYCINNPIIIKDINGEDGVIVISGSQVTKASTVGAYKSSKSGKADYTMYAMNIYKNTSIHDYNKRTKNGEESIMPDATMWVARDAYHNSKNSKKDRSSKRYGTNNETPPGTYYLEYDPNGVGTKKGHHIRITSKKGQDVVLGPDGKRNGIHIHEWGPYDGVGCITFGTNGKFGKTPGLDKLLELYPELETEENIWIIIEPRFAYFDQFSQVWRHADSQKEADRMEASLQRAYDRFVYHMNRAWEIAMEQRMGKIRK